MLEEDEGLSFWPSVSDLFLTLFIVAIALAVLGLLILSKDQTGSAVTVDDEPGGPEQIEALELELAQVALRNGALEQDLASAESHIERMEQELLGLEGVEVPRGDRPPIIVISDSDRSFFFDLGSSLVGSEFESDLRLRAFKELASEILVRNRSGQLNVDTLEVIGHTDGVPVTGGGNLDQGLPEYLRGEDEAFESLLPGSNNDLGLLRAMAIKRAWHGFVEQHPSRDLLGQIAVRTYSAGQTLPINLGRVDLEDARARRIEIRLTKLGES